MIGIRVDVSQVVRAFKYVTKYFTDGLTALQSYDDDIAAATGRRVVDMMYLYIDSMARSDPQRYQHMYEWGKSGQSTSRLFNITYSTRNNTTQLGFEYVDSTEPTPDGYVFRRKAQALEEGWTFHISPVQSDVLVFEIDGETIFVHGSVITTPGEAVQGNFTQLFNDYMTHVAPTTVQRVLQEFNKFPNFKQGTGSGAAAMQKDVKLLNVDTTSNQ